MKVLPDLGEYKVIVEESGTREDPGCIIELCLLNDLLHSRGDEPAYTAWKKVTGEVVCRRWHKNGLEHRNYDLPAVIRDDGKYITFDWYTEGHNTKSFTVSKRTGHTVCKLFYAEAPDDAPSDDYLCTAYHYDEDNGEFISKKFHYAQYDVNDPTEISLAPNLPFPTPAP